MAACPVIDPSALSHLRNWIGKEEVIDDVLTSSVSDRFHAALSLPGVSAASGQAAPRLIHFCLGQPAVSTAELGVDGHPAKGGFLPPVPLPRRMWAGSQITFHGDILVGSPVRRISRISDVVIKSGRSGALCFVTVDHRFETGHTLAVEDRQTIVYRDAVVSDGALAKDLHPAEPGQTTILVEPSPILLFRYSALTFNGHRIHYDLPYATGVEGYPGLVVHGPLQATLLYHLASQQRGECPKHFNFRSLSSLFDRDPFNCHASDREDGGMDLWTAHAGGPVAMQAEAHWQ